YEAHPENAWQRLKMRVRTPKALAVMMEVAAWREREAQTSNIPRRRVLKDEAIYDIAEHSPTSEKELAALRSLHQGFARSARGRAVLEAVQAGLKRDLDTLPPIRKGKPLSPDETAVMDLLRVLLKAAAGRHGVAPKLIATVDDLEKIARDSEADVPALKGWRRELFGADALAVKRGELGLVVKDGQVTVLPARGLDDTAAPPPARASGRQKKRSRRRRKGEQGEEAGTRQAGEKRAGVPRPA
ncbi:MAG: hypothetical protein D6773_19525, partial [Alphaproteobacteria bacterium]